VCVETASPVNDVVTATTRVPAILVFTTDAACRGSAVRSAAVDGDDTRDTVGDAKDVDDVVESTVDTDGDLTDVSAPTVTEAPIVRSAPERARPIRASVAVSARRLSAVKAMPVSLASSVL